jgi:hypothetical protein
MGIVMLAVVLQWTFNSDSPGGLPAGWQTRGDSRKAVYSIEADADANQYLAARSQGGDVQLGTAISLKAQDHLTLSWRWRAWELPTKASERNLKTMDSAASVYVVFGSRLFPRILKYVWSTSEPAGASFKHPRSDRMAIIVVASGRQSLGQWQMVTRNLVADYKMAFGSRPENLTAIGVKTDSDSTASSARADYDDFRLED